MGGEIASIKRIGAIAAACAATAFALPSQAEAAGCDRHAAPSGNNSNAGTEAAPLKSAQALADALQAGETGCLHEGSYSSDSQIKVATANVTLTSAPGERAEIVGRFWVASGAAGATITDLDLNGKSSSVLPSPTVNADDVTFRGNDVTNDHTAICFLLGTSGYGDGDRALIEGNKIHDCGVMPAANHDHGIYVSRSNGSVIRDNWIYDNADRGVQFYPEARNTLVSGNVIDGNGQGVIFGGDGSTGSSDNTVENNIITNSKVRHNIESHWEGPTGSGNVARNNCVHGGVRDEGDGAISLEAGGFKVANSITADPEFVDRAGKNFELAPNSPCAGVLDGATPTAHVNSVSKADRISAKAGKRRVKAGKRVKLSGRAKGAAVIKVMKKVRRGWVKAGSKRVRSNGKFKRRVKVSGKRKARFKVTAKGMAESKTLKVRIA